MSSIKLEYIKNNDGHFVCPYCGEIKERQNTMHYHMKKHEGQMPFNCKTCKKGFLQKQTLELHIQAKHPDVIIKENKQKKEYCCPFTDCEFKSLSKGNRRIHTIRVHFKKELSEFIEHNSTCYKCLICSDEFISSTHFYYHLGECAYKYDVLSSNELLMNCL
jgi:transcription elongation factor Elf1